MLFNEKIKEKGLHKKWIAKQLSMSPTALSGDGTPTRPLAHSIEITLKQLLGYTHVLTK